jgi:glutathione S-transferase
MRAAMTALQVPLTADAKKDVARIDAIWSECRARYKDAGPWLFGRYCIADAMYAPVVLRFNSYGAEVSPAARSYVQTALADPLLQEWIGEAMHEITVQGRPTTHT